MASPTGWTWVWVNSGSWWWTGRPDMLWFMGLQSRTRLSEWTELNWTPKNWCFWNLVLKTLDSPMVCKEIKPVNPKANQSQIFIGRIDAETETSILWPPNVKNWLIGKYLDAGKDWRHLEEKGMTEDEMVGWHHLLDGHEFEQVPGVGDGKGSLVCCSPWGYEELGTTKRLNWTQKKQCGNVKSDKVLKP